MKQPRKGGGAGDHYSRQTRNAIDRTSYTQPAAQGSASGTAREKRTAGQIHLGEWPGCNQNARNPGGRQMESAPPALATSGSCSGIHRTGETSATQQFRRRGTASQDSWNTDWWELPRRDEPAATELDSHLSKLGVAEGAEEEEVVSRKAAGTAVNMVRKEALSRATMRLTSHGIASLGPEEAKNFRNLQSQDHPPELPPMSWRMKGTRHATELDYPTFADRVRHATQEAEPYAYGIM